MKKAFTKLSLSSVMALAAITMSAPADATVFNGVMPDGFHVKEGCDWNGKQIADFNMSGSAEFNVIESCLDIENPTECVFNTPEFTLEPGKRYLLSYYINTRRITDFNNPSEYTVSFLNWTDEELPILTAGSSVWQIYENEELEVAETTTMSLGIKFYIYGSSYAYVHGVSILESDGGQIGSNHYASGTVLCNGEPVKDAEVEVYNDDFSYDGKTNSKGAFKIRVTRTNQEYDVVAMKSGYLDSEAGRWIKNENENFDLNIVENNVDAETLETSVSDNNVLFSWGAIENLGSLDEEVNYIVYLDGVEYTTTENRSVVISTLENGTYDVAVAAKFLPKGTITARAETSVTVDASGIEGIDADNVATAAYDLSGRRVNLNACEQGIYIVRYADGSARRVIVRK